jgi:integrase/recombinase XerD
LISLLKRWFWGGAIGTARKYELYRELTSDNWRLNLSQLSHDIADMLEASQPDMRCDSMLPFFEGQPVCSDRLRHAGGLLELARSFRFAPIVEPFSAQALMKAGIAKNCRPSPATDGQASSIDCKLDDRRLRNQLADELVDLIAQFAPNKESLKNDIQKSALSTDSDRRIYVTSRGGPITGTLLSDFGAFLDYKFREYDYFMGIYDAVIVATSEECSRIFPGSISDSAIQTCRDQISEKLYRSVGLDEDPKGKYLFALMAKQEFGNDDGLRYAYDPMPSEDRDIQIIFEGLKKSTQAASMDQNSSEELISIEREFFEYLKTEGFAPTPSTDGGTSLLTLIMDDPEYWAHELVNRATSRLVHLEQEAETIYQAREPDPQLQEEANTGLMGAGALAMRTITYQPPRFTFSPSTAPGDGPVDQITPEHVLTFLNRLTEGNKPYTQRIRYSQIFSFFNFVRNNIDPELRNPCDRPMIRKLYRERVPLGWKIIEKETIDEIIFRTTKIRNRLILELMARGGMRIGEVLKLRLGDLQDRKLILREPKSDKEYDFVFIPEKVADRLRQYALQVCNAPSDRIFPISYEAARIIVIKSGKLVGVKLRPHDLRRHSATFASRSGVPIEIVSKVILRHANLSTTQRYLGMTSGIEAIRWI